MPDALTDAEFSLLEVWLADEMNSDIPDDTTVAFGSLHACEIDRVDKPTQVC